MELFKICIEDLYWIDGSKDNPDDLCLHGKMYTVIGEQKLVHDGSVTVSASALYFLKTLTEDHIINKDNQMMPCCGHMIIPNEDGKTVTIAGCTQGVDWTVLHEGENVKIILEDGAKIIVPLEMYKNEVFKFADEISAFITITITKQGHRVFSMSLF